MSVGPSSPDQSGWSWLVGRGRLPTTASGTERIVVLLIVGIRIGTLLQMAPSAVQAVEASPWPGAALASYAAAVAAAVTVSVVAVRRGCSLGAWGTALDLMLAAVLLGLGSMTVPVDDRIGTWVGFQPGYALSVLISSSPVRNRVVWAPGTLTVVLAFFVYLGDALTEKSTMTVVGNVLTYILLTVIARGSVSYLRRLGQDADDARARAAELARKDEERRAQVVIHNGATVMSLLADPTVSPLVRTQLEAQARHEAQRLRTYLRGTPPPAADEDQLLLADAIVGVAAAFPELPLELAVDLGADIVLSEADAVVVRDALTSVLLNVRLHANAHQVVVHLDRDDQQWTLTVHDDGRGFEPAQTDLGVGLREIVVGELGRRGIGATVRSRPGQGTTVTLNAPATTPTVANAR